jgi:hypothetical protein
MPIPMDPSDAEKLKQVLRQRAKEKNVDLSNSNYKYTLWLENAGQGYFCCAHASHEDPVYAAMQRFILSGGAILEVKESGDRVTLFTCEVG